MKKKHPESPDAAKLRCNAEERLRERQNASPSETRQSTDEAQRQLHELQVYQLELEMQNEELRESRAEVEASAARYIDLYDFAPIGYFTLTSDGTIRQMNLPGALLLGVDRSILIGKCFGVFVAVADQPVFKAFLQQVFAAKSPPACEIELAGNDQLQRTVHIKATLSDDGQECRVMVMDITERRQTEDALKTSEANLSAILEKNSDGIVIVDAAGVVLYVNPAAEKLFGKSKEDFSGYPFGFPLSADKTEDICIIRKGDTLCEVELRVVPVHWQNQPAFQLSVRDITERNLARDKLIKSERFARSTLNGLSAHIAIIRDDGTIEVVNTAWRNFAVANPPVDGNVCEGANYLAICDNAEGPDSALATLAAKGIRDVLVKEINEFQLEYPCHSPEEQRWFVLHVTPFPGDSPARVVVAHENITERKLAETELVKKLEELERFRDATVEREFRIKDLRDRVKELEAQLKKAQP